MKAPVSWIEEYVDLPDSVTTEALTDRLTALVTNLLDMSRISTGSVSPFLTEVGVVAAIRAALAPLPGGDRVRVEVPSDLVRLSVGIEDVEDLLADLTAALA